MKKLLKGIILVIKRVNQIYFQCLKLFYIKRSYEAVINGRLLLIMGETYWSFNRNKKGVDPSFNRFQSYFDA